MYLRAQEINEIYVENETGNTSQKQNTGHNKTMNISSLFPRLFISRIVWIFLGFIKPKQNRKPAEHWIPLGINLVPQRNVFSASMNLSLCGETKHVQLLHMSVAS
jgi:hypothetical protein